MDMLRIILWVLIFLALVFIGWQRYKRGHLMAVFGIFAGIALAVYVGLCVLLFLMQSSVLYQPWRGGYELTPRDVGLDFEPVTLQAADGISLAGWYIPAKPGGGQWTVLFCHGNAGNNSHRLDTLELLHDLGLDCLIVDYRGYGESEGSPTEAGTLLDIKAGWQWLVDEQGKSPERIMLFGRSLGGSIAAIVARDVRPGAVVLESTFTSFLDAGKRIYPWLPVSLFARFDYNTLEAVKELECPVLIIHSPDDEIIAYSFGECLFEAANEPKLFRQLRGGHNEGFYENSLMYQQIWQEWLDFLKAPYKPHDDGLNAAMP
jgi:fermentation-respiration switch protein FrsA (DUF1100 family)